MPNICSNTYEKHATNIRYSTIMCNMRVIVFIIIIRRNSRYEYKALEPVRHLLGKSRHPPVTPSAEYLCNIFFHLPRLCRIICSTAVTAYYEPPKRNKYGESGTVGRSVLARCIRNVNRRSLWTCSHLFQDNLIVVARTSRTKHARSIRSCLHSQMEEGTST